MRTPFFKIRLNAKKEYYWIMYGGNGEPVCWSEGYSSEQNARNSLQFVKNWAASAPLQ